MSRCMSQAGQRTGPQQWPLPEKGQGRESGTRSIIGEYGRNDPDLDSGSGLPVSTTCPQKAGIDVSSKDTDFAGAVGMRHTSPFEDQLDSEPLLTREPTSPSAPSEQIRFQRVAAAAPGDFPVAETFLFLVGVVLVSGALAWCAMSGRAVTLIEFLHQNKLVGSAIISVIFVPIGAPFSSGCAWRCDGWA